MRKRAERLNSQSKETQSRWLDMKKPQKSAKRVFGGSSTSSYNFEDVQLCTDYRRAIPLQITREEGRVKKYF